MDKMEYYVILEALYGLRESTRKEAALAHYDGEKSIYNELAERIWVIDDTIEDVRKKLNKLLYNGD